jgi:glutamine synthetase adenylyltransferase
MTDQRTTTADAPTDSGARQRAIEAYEGARDRAADTLGQAPLLALAGGLAAGALIAALLPRTEAETRLVRPTARRVKKTANAALEAARDTGSQRLDAMGLNRDKGEQTIRKLLDELTDAAKASADAALDAARKANDG